MRLALLSDVHANLPALEAVLSRIDAERPELDGIYHLGDLVGYAPWPNEVVERLTDRGIPGVCGNYDSTVALRYDHCGCRYENPEQEALSHRSFAWTLEAVTEKTRTALARLPFRLDLRPFGGHRPGPTVVLVHGSPGLNTLYWTEGRSEDFARKMITKAGLRAGDVMAFGHTHLPWHHVVDGVHLVNTGSVGRPKDGDPRAGFVILGIEEKGSDTGRVDVRFERVEYDIEAAVRGIEESTLPDAFSAFLRAGGSSAGGS